MTGVLLLGFLAALGVLTYVFKRWPHVQRSFDVHVDDALEVVNEDAEAVSRAMHPATVAAECSRFADDVEAYVRRRS